MKHLILLLATLLPFSVVQAGEPSAMFGQELASVSKPDEINIDFYVDPLSTVPNYIRVGLDDGEIMVDYSGSQSLSYKWFINKELALYGGLGLNASTADQIIIGGAYTINNDNIRFNINPVINAGGGTTQTDLYLGAFMKFDGIKDKKMMFGAQYHADLTNSTNSGVTLGLRWLARKDITIDLALFNANQLDFPGVFAINMAF
ncbi:MAG: hypothetical protein OEX12_09270 [Gammaproteobacteria bacterium]|nr:hypothetical protein [Gammaproteobacteria bacterium]